jgi:hypothetical protein
VSDTGPPEWGDGGPNYSTTEEISFRRSISDLTWPQAIVAVGVINLVTQSIALVGEALITGHL